MYTFIVLSVLLSLTAGTSAIPTHPGIGDENLKIPSNNVFSRHDARGLTIPAQLTYRAVKAPPACAAKGKRAVPISGSIAKRIAQNDLPAVAQSWQDLCNKSGGDITTGNPCVKLAGQDGITALLGAADPCAQQDNADAMINFAKSKGVKNKQALIDNAIAYRKHPRNALNLGGFTPSTPFCQKAPKNAELKGVANGQLDGVDPGLFGSPNFAVVPFGDPASCPFGQTPNVATCTCEK